MRTQPKQFFVIRERTYHRDLPCCTDFETRNLVTNDPMRLRNINRKLDRINTDDCNGNPRMVLETRDGKSYHYEVQDEKRAAQNEKNERTPGEGSARDRRTLGFFYPHSRRPARISD